MCENCSRWWNADGRLLGGGEWQRAATLTAAAWARIGDVKL